MKPDFFLKGKLITIVPTNTHHLAKYTTWHKWEGDLNILEEEESFANQQDRTKRLKLIKSDLGDTSFYLSVIRLGNDELISLLELHILGSELYCPENGKSRQGSFPHF